MKNWVKYLIVSLISVALTFVLTLTGSFYAFSSYLKNNKPTTHTPVSTEVNIDDLLPILNRASGKNIPISTIDMQKYETGYLFTGEITKEDLKLFLKDYPQVYNTIRLGLIFIPKSFEIEVFVSVEEQNNTPTLIVRSLNIEGFNINTSIPIY